MRRFSIYTPRGAAADTESWLDTGFREMAAGQTGDDAERPDVIIANLGRDDAGLCREVNALLPKVVVLLSEIAAGLPEQLEEQFRVHCWQKAGGFYVVGTSLEPALAEPEWGAYCSGGEIDAPQALKAVSDQIYRHLLADVFRETAEWCGHTFSVVGYR
ncbi:MAG: hypothetical protein P4N59_14050 [Negativicutes bacterium]|nr:hypothetical protein [Negativicutes bacterium]